MQSTFLWQTVCTKNPYAAIKFQFKRYQLLHNDQRTWIKPWAKAGTLKEWVTGLFIFRICVISKCIFNLKYKCVYTKVDADISRSTSLYLVKYMPLCDPSNLNCDTTATTTVQVVRDLRNRMFRWVHDIAFSPLTVTMLSQFPLAGTGGRCTSYKHILPWDSLDSYQVWMTLS